MVEIMLIGIVATIVAVGKFINGQFADTKEYNHLW